MMTSAAPSQSWFDMAIEEERDRVEGLSPCERSSHATHHPITSTPVRTDDNRSRLSKRIPARRRLVDGYDQRSSQYHEDQKYERRSRSRGSSSLREPLDFSPDCTFDKGDFRSPLREDARSRFGSMAEATDSWAQVVSKMSSSVKRVALSERSVPNEEESSAGCLLKNPQSVTSLSETREQPHA